MGKIKQLFHTPKNVILFIVCIVAVLGIIGSAAGLIPKYFLSSQITVQEATQIALLDANVLEADANYIQTKQDTENGVSLYDIEIHTETMKYEYEINRKTGDIYSKSKEQLASRESVQGGSLQASGESNANPQTTEQSAIEQSESALPAATPQEGNTSQEGNTPQEGNTSQEGKTPQETTGRDATQNITGKDTPQQGAETQQNTAGLGTQSNSGQISIEEAKSAALADAGLTASDVVFTKEKSDYEDEIAVYDVEFYAAEYEYEYEINASTGAVYSKNVEAHRRSGTGHLGHSGNITATGASIGEEEAKSIAVNHAGFALADVNLLKVKLDMEDGKTVYEVEFYKENKEYDYTIDASTGTILEYDID